MSKATTCVDTRSATSLPASGDGLTPSAVQVGPTTDLFGQALAPANRSASSGRALASPTSVTSGLSGAALSRSESLALSLVNRLMGVTAEHGSTLYGLTWKLLATPSHRRFFLLRASEHRTAGTAYSSWVTPSTRDWKDTPGMSRVSSNPDGSVRRRVDQLPRQARLVVLGGGQPGCPAVTDTSVPFNPEHSRWLMGFPPEWSSCAPTVTRSSRRSPKSSSVPTCSSGGSDATG